MTLLSHSLSFSWGIPAKPTWLIWHITARQTKTCHFTAKHFLKLLIFCCSDSGDAAIKPLYCGGGQPQSLFVFPFTYVFWVKLNLASQDAHIQYITLWMRSTRVHPHLESAAVTSANCDPKKLEHTVTLYSHFKFKSTVSRGPAGAHSRFGCSPVTGTRGCSRSIGRKRTSSPAPDDIDRESPTGVALLMLHVFDWQNTPLMWWSEDSNLQKKSVFETMTENLTA